MKIKEIIREILYTFSPRWNDEYTKVNKYWKKKQHFPDKVKELEVKLPHDKQKST